MENQFKISYWAKVNDQLSLEDEITKPDQVHALKTKLIDMGAEEDSSIIFDIECPELVEKLLKIHYYYSTDGALGESLEAYEPYLAEMGKGDFDVEPWEIMFHPIYEFYKEIDQHFEGLWITLSRNNITVTAEFC